MNLFVICLNWPPVFGAQRSAVGEIVIAVSWKGRIMRSETVGEVYL